MARRAAKAPPPLIFETADDEDEVGKDGPAAAASAVALR